MNTPKDQGKIAGTIVAWLLTAAVIVIVVVATWKLVEWMLNL